MERGKRVWLGCAVLMLLTACGSGGDSTTDPNPDPPATTGRINGTVMNSGTGVAGAQVAGSGTLGNTTTSSSGAFSFTNVAPGSYTLTLTLPAGLELNAGEALQKSATVTAGGVSSVAWSLKSPVSGNSRTIDIRNNAFDPTPVTIAVGTTVTWTNRDAVAHTVTAAGSFDSSALGQNTPFSHTFNAAGTVDYVCTLHAGMNGRIIVQ